MRKRVPVTQLRLGMVVDGIESSWLTHPFWRSSFALTQQKTLDQIYRSGIEYVWIDTDLGQDVAAEAEPILMPEAEPAAQPQANSDASPANPFQDELKQAVKICLSAQEAIAHMFSEARMGQAIDTQVARVLVDDITASVTRQSSALISLARLKTADNYTYMHSVAVCALMVALARQLGLDEAEVRAVGFAGLVHDIGKMQMPVQVLNKAGPLDDSEWGVIKTHPLRGWELLRYVGVGDAVALDVCLHHHEWVDGSGYPKGLKGSRLSLYARMGAVCDIYDAVTSNRAYKAGWDPAYALQTMHHWTEQQLDKSVFQAFVRSLGIYPVGSLVRLSDETLAVVCAQNPEALLAPVVTVFFSLHQHQRVPPRQVDLAAPDAQQQIVAREDPRRWGFSDLDAIWSDGLLD